MKTEHQIAYIAHNEHLLEGLAEHLDPIIFVQGLGMSVQFWELAMLDEIREQLPWYAISLPMHYPCTYSGDALEAELDTEAFAKTLGETIKALVGERRVRVVGHSVGAFQALAYAARYPKQCAAVMCIGGFVSGRAQGLAGKLQLLALGGPIAREVFQGMWRAQQTSFRITKQLVTQYAGDKQALLAYVPFEPTLRLVYEDIKRFDLDSIYTITRWLYDVDVSDSLHRIDCGVWVVAGTADPVVSYEHQVDFAERLPNGHLFPMQGAGHLSFAEREEEFNALLLSFALNAESGFAGF